MVERRTGRGRLREDARCRQDNPDHAREEQGVHYVAADDEAGS